MLSPTIWGNSIWASIHYIALGAPLQLNQQDKQNYKNFFLAIGNVLPCQKCIHNFQKHLYEIPIDNYLNTRDQLFEWTVKLHNIVNLEQKKQQWTVDQAKLHYLNNNKPIKYNLYYVLCLSFFIILIFLFIKRKPI